MSDENWSVIFYSDEQGRRPVREFIDSLDQKTQARFTWSIEQLRVRNVQAREPLVKHLVGKVWELREESQTKIYRLLYFFARGRRIVFLHGFQKKSDKTPSKEIQIAQKRLEDFLSMQGGEG